MAVFSTFTPLALDCCVLDYAGCGDLHAPGPGNALAKPFKSAAIVKLMWVNTPGDQGGVASLAVHPLPIHLDETRGAGHPVYLAIWA